MFAPCLYLSQKSLDLELALANASGLIPMQLSEDHFTRSQPNPNNAFTLAPSSAYRLRKRASSRIPEPVAMVSTAESSPMISKYTTPSWQRWTPWSNEHEQET